jgi:hypothetical protein
LNAEYLTNFLGTPLLKEDAFEIWQEEQCHVKCLQDPVDVMLYTQTDAISMGGISLQVYRFFFTIWWRHFWLHLFTVSAFSQRFLKFILIFVFVFV